MAENKKFVITVGRQYGSGGAEMAKRLGERLRRLGIGTAAVEQVAREQDDLRAVRSGQLRQSAQKVALLPAALRRLRAGERLKRRIEVQIRRV